MSLLKDFKGTADLQSLDSDLIKEIQSILKKTELYSGEVNGIADAKTITAFSEFKRKNYLEKPLMLGESTSDALLRVNVDYPPNKDSDTTNAVNVRTIAIPGISRITFDTPICTGSNFTWGEATKNLTRIPDSRMVVNKIIVVAKRMDAVRRYLGDRPITVTSWYRPIAVNAAVGGAKNSRHTLGDAVDFQVQGIHPQEVYRRLDAWHGASGGLASSNSFTHIDMRGYKARWRYN